MMENISHDEYKRIKQKMLVRTFATIPIVVLTSVYVTGSLIDGKIAPLSELIFPIIVVFIVATIVWVLFRDTQIKREQRREVKRKYKSKKRVAIEYSLTILAFIILLSIAYTM